MSLLTPRDPATLSATRFDVLVVGGGITGAWVALDCALRGQSVALIEKHDFGAATSSRSSKILHGGVRYLQQLDFARVRESARERALVIRAAPHLINHVPFLIPTYRTLQRSKMFLFAGMMGYQLLAAGTQRILSDKATRAPAGYGLSVAQLREIVDLPDDQITGGWVLHECQMESSERMTQAVIARARQAGALLTNYTALERFSYSGGRVTGATVLDVEKGSQLEIEAKVTVNATGPWCDDLIEQFDGRPLNTGYARGAHIVTRSLIPDFAMALPSKFQADGTVGRGSRHIFIIPWRDRSLIGTSYQETASPCEPVHVLRDEISQLLDTVNAALPWAALGAEDVLHAFAGFYPLQSRKLDGRLYQGTGEYQLIDHARTDGVAGVITALGAKYTTARQLAEQTADLVEHKLAAGTVVGRRPTRTVKLDGGDIADIKHFEQEKIRQHDGLFRAETTRHLIKRYGTRIDDLAAICRNAPALATPITPERMTVGAELLYAADQEMAIHLSDAVLRRTDLGTLGDPGPEALNTCAQILGEQLGWSAAQQRLEVDLLSNEIADSDTQVVSDQQWNLDT